MCSVGVDPERVLARMPLALVDARGRGLRLPAGSPVNSFLLGVLAHPTWSLAERLHLLLAALRWTAGGFRCEPDRSVAALCAALPGRVQRELVEPLCVAALNTEAAQASAAVFLRVLRDALFSGRGSADLLLPRQPLGELLPDAALRWLRTQGARVRLGQRVQSLDAAGTGWQLDGEAFRHVVLACSAREAARLARPVDAAWADQAAGFGYEPIITAWIDAPVVQASFPMIALADGPAQFAFDLGALGQRPGRMSLVVSGARQWVDAGQGALEAALQAQVREQLATVLPNGWRLAQVFIEKRATFRCTPGLRRPHAALAPGLRAAGDYVQGPYPATLEGAVRSGEAALEGMRQGR
jgi:hydroxysqualene dehydroxylase